MHRVLEGTRYVISVNFHPNEAQSEARAFNNQMKEHYGLSFMNHLPFCALNTFILMVLLRIFLAPRVTGSANKTTSQTPVQTSQEASQQKPEQTAPETPQETVPQVSQQTSKAKQPPKHSQEASQKQTPQQTLEETPDETPVRTPGL